MKQTKTMTLDGFLTIRPQDKETHFHVKGEDGNSILIRHLGEEQIAEETFVPGTTVTVTIEYDDTLIVRRNQDG